ncbi:MAG: trigger factor [Acidobacteriota bacterium]
MLVTLRDISSIKKNVEVEIPAEAVKKEIGLVTREFAQQAKLPGFRPGKIPTNMIRTRFQKEIRQEVVERLLPRYFHEAVAEKGLATVGDPMVKHVDAVSEDAPLKFEAEFEVKPTFELQEFRGLTVDEVNTAIEDPDVDQMIERLRDQSSSFRIVDDRAAGDGDYVVMDIVSSGEGLETRTSEAAHVQVGEETPLPELHEAVRGKQAGDQASFEKSYDDEAVNEELRGKTVHYELTIKEIRDRVRPELDDEFARSLGWDSTEIMRATVRQDLQKHKEQEGAHTQRQALSEKLVALHEFEVPEVMIEEHLGNALRNYARFLTSQGVDLERAELDWKKIRDDFRPDAEKRARRALILEAIARAENIAVADPEVDAEIRRASAESRRDFAEVKHQLRHNGSYEEIRQSLMQDKALELVLKEARIVPAKE